MEASYCRRSPSNASIIQGLFPLIRSGENVETCLQASVVLLTKCEEVFLQWNVFASRFYANVLVPVHMKRVCKGYYTSHLRSHWLQYRNIFLCFQNQLAAFNSCAFGYLTTATISFKLSQIGWTLRRSSFIISMFVMSNLFCNWHRLPWNQHSIMGTTVSNIFSSCLGELMS